MKKVFSNKSVIGVIGTICLCFVHSIVFAEMYPMEDYDNFDDKKFNGVKSAINTHKWTGAERGNNIGKSHREIKGKRLEFGIRGWGEKIDAYDPENPTRSNNRNRLLFKEMPGHIAGVCFNPQAKKVEFGKCEAEDTGLSGARLRYFGHIYRTNNTSSGYDTTGVVHAQIDFRQSYEGLRDGWLKKKEFDVNGAAWECANENCTYPDTWNSGDEEIDLYLGRFNSNNKVEFCVGYDPDEHEMVFTASDKKGLIEEKRITSADLPGRVEWIDDEYAFHTIEARVDTQDCTAGKISTYFLGSVDNVKVYRRPELPPAP